MRLITLWQKNGKKFPFRVRAEYWSKQSFMQVEGYAPVGQKDFYGWNESGVAIRASQESEHWEPSETEPLVNDKPAVTKSNRVKSK